MKLKEFFLLVTCKVEKEGFLSTLGHQVQQVNKLATKK